MQPRQHLGIAPIGLDAIAGALRDARGRNHGAVDPFRGEVPVERVAAGSRLIDDVNPCALRDDLPQRPLHVAHAAADRPVVPHFAAYPARRDRYVNRFLMHVHADVNGVRLCHGLPPLVQRCALVPTSWLGAEPLRATHGNTGGGPPLVKP
jgi:hypothetical protein